MSSNPALFKNIFEEIFSHLLPLDNLGRSLESFYQNPHDFSNLWPSDADRPKRIFFGINDTPADKRDKIYDKNRFVEEIKWLMSRYVGGENPHGGLLKGLQGFPIHDNPRVKDDRGIDIDNFAYTIFPDSNWFISNKAPLRNDHKNDKGISTQTLRPNSHKMHRFAQFEGITIGNASPSGESDARSARQVGAFLKNLSREVPLTMPRLREWLGDQLGNSGILKDCIDTYSTFETDFQKFEKQAVDFLNLSMYNSQEVKYFPDVRAFFTSYVPEDIEYQLQEIRTTDGRLFFRTLKKGEWTRWELGSPDKTGTSSIELTSGDVGAVPLGNQDGSYLFNLDLEAMKPGEVLYCLTRDITLSGLPESLRYGSEGYRKTPDEILNNPTRGYFPNSMGCYGLFDPQNDINEPDSNGLMEIMPSTELFSNEIPRPIMEQQRGWLETKYDGMYYFQKWEPLSPSNKNWCDELDKPRYTYYRKGTLQISDSIYGSKPFIKWEKWRANHNVDTVVDWGIVTPLSLAKKAGKKSLETVLSILNLSEIYDQPDDTTYMWTIWDEGNNKAVRRTVVTNTAGYSSEEPGELTTGTVTWEGVYEPKEIIKNGIFPNTGETKNTLSTMIVGIPLIRDEGGPPIKITRNVKYGSFQVGETTTYRRKSIFSRLTSIKTKGIVYYEWRDLGQIYKFDIKDGRPIPNIKDLDTNETNRRVFADDQPDSNTRGGMFLPYNLFALKEKSSDFTYYREGRVISEQDLFSLPEKVFRTYSVWTPWHSVDERIKSIESRVNFMETLQGLAPASNFSYIPILSRSLSNVGISGVTKNLPNIDNAMKELYKSRTAAYGKAVIGEYTPLYFLRFGYNYLLDLYDTPSSFWGNWISYVQIGEGETGNKLDFDYTGNGINPGSPPFSDGTWTGWKVPVDGHSYDLIVKGINKISTKSYEAAIYAGGAALAILISSMITGTLAASLGVVPSIIASVLTLGAVIAHKLVLTFASENNLREPAQSLRNNMDTLWSSQYIPLHTALSYTTRRDFDSRSGTDVLAKIDTSLWGWMSELKRRTDVIKLIEAEFKLIINLLGQAIAVFNYDFIVVMSALLPVPPATGVQPIPFFTFGVPAPSLTGFAYYCYDIHYVPYQGDYPMMFNRLSLPDMRPKENFLKSIYRETTYELIDGKITDL